MPGNQQEEPDDQIVLAHLQQDLYSVIWLLSPVT